MSQFAAYLIAKNIYTQSPVLDLGRSGLTELPEVLFDCVWLEELILSYCWREDDGLKESSNKWHANGLSSLPPGFAKLKKLKKLVCRGTVHPRWEIADLSALSGLVHLTHLDLSYNQISDLSALSGLVKLKSLNVSHNNLNHLSALSGLVNLQNLYADDNQVSDLSPLSGLVNLKSLDVNRNEIGDLAALSMMVHLRKVDLTLNRISDLSALSGLTNLEKLEVTHNQVTDLSPLSGLINLRKLSVDYNQILDLSPLSGLVKLESLSVTHNQISDLSPLSGMVHLAKLEAGANQLSSISPEFLEQFPALTEAWFGWNPFTSIPGKIAHLPALKDYLRDVQKGSVSNNLFNVGILGNSGVGKTQVAKRLTNRQNFAFEPLHQLTRSRTVFLSCLDGALSPDELEMIISEIPGATFPTTGRDYMYKFHRKVILLVWDLENETDPVPICTPDGSVCPYRSLESWIHSCYFDYGEKQVIVVQNKTDLHPGYGLSNQEIESYKEEYAHLHDFVQVSAKTGEGFDVLEKSIVRLFEQDEHWRADLLKLLPASWVAVRREVEKWKLEGKKQVHFSDFHALCAQHGVAASAETILEFLRGTDLFGYRKSDQQIVFEFE